MSAIDYALRNLRHLYEQMLSGHVRATPEDISRAATGLLGPAIENVEKAQTRQSELLSTIVRLTNETPFADEAKDALEQRGKLVAEIGGLKARVAELEREATELADRSESWRVAHFKWQTWSADLLQRIGAQPAGGEWGDGKSRDLIAATIDSARSECEALKAENERLKARILPDDELNLICWALGALSSDYNEAPHNHIAKLQEKLREWLVPSEVLASKETPK